MGRALVARPVDCICYKSINNSDEKCEQPMTFIELLDSVPAYAKDLKLNLSSLLQQQELNEQQVWGTVAASAMASRNPQILKTLLAEAAAHLSPQALEAAKSAAAIMGMNNVYYRFQHLTKNPKYATLPARLRMNVLRTHGIDPVDFELWCTAVSAINGCGLCVDSHEKILRDKGVSEEAILAAVRLASVIHGLATVFDTETVAPSQAVPV
jgi:alkyl hydroperoxide reductase subunit D